MQKHFYTYCTVVMLWVLSLGMARAQNSQVSGTIIDETGFPMPGVTVVLKGTTSGTTTDLDGKYSISVPSGGVLVFSFIGYVTVEEMVGTRSTIDLSLSPDMADLEEVVVIGYGTAKKRDITGAVSSVNPNKLENENPNSVQDILRGNAAGLNVGISTDAKGGGSLEVRGRTSLNAGNTPCSSWTELSTTVS